MARPVGSAPVARHYLMCRPTYFAVEYAINPWMDPDAGVDRTRAIRQWEELRDIHLSLGHRVSEVAPVEGLPDMVFAANGGLVVDGRVYGARFASAERTPEGPAYLDWFRKAGYTETREPKHVNEGEGDFITMDDVILAATGFRTEAAAHQEAERFLGRPVVTLQLTDPRFYHLDTALFALSGEQIAYYPGAFSAGSRRVLRALYPDALLATEEDAAVLGLNAVCDGHDVVMAAEATALAGRLRALGYTVHPVELDELRKAGGGAKCCTLVLRDASV
ncbi:N-dimethylarginine dimethylaminohydrolase [Nocardiopsis arvandica]|uniref:N-dimethylarginine dimethylaminohydrolase n=1 Tax=Nocardiopsis sinuspersici TaxID=501010 RepID=A0A7Y9XFW2_9ACTN|nr:dimethylargininase [Nocardiopsis sinuspersici]NYH55046.1 N-dimethylarginine dimethylaminohydrolase [Nocardiopsis sinuspersici]